MARTYLTNIDLVQNEIQNAVVHQLASDPGSPVEGQVWYNTTTHLLKWYNGSGVIDPLARANHSGTQTAATISDFDTQVRTSRLDQMAAPTADVSLNSQKITGLATPTAATDAANKGYVDNAVAGLDWKESVRAASTANVDIATGLQDTDTLDGVTLATGDRVLLKDQTAPAENGIYVVVASGAASRATDADTGAEILQAAVWVREGTTNADTGWVCTTNGPITIDTTSLAFAQFNGSQAYAAGDGLTLTGNTFDVGAGTGISVGADTVSIDTAVVVQKYASDIGDGSTTSIVVTHNLGTKDVTVAVYDNTTPWGEVYPEVRHTSTTQVTLVFAVAPTTNQYRVVVHA